MEYGGFVSFLTATTVSRMEKNRAVITQNEDTRTPSDGRLMHTFCFLLCATFRVLYTPEVNIFGETKHVECFRWKRRSVCCSGGTSTTQYRYVFESQSGIDDLQRSAFKYQQNSRIGRLVTKICNANIQQILQHNRMAEKNTGKNCSPKGLSSISPSTGRWKMPDYKLLMINQNRLQDNGLETVAKWAWCIFYLLLYFVTLIQRIKHWPINNCIPLDCIRASDAKGVSFIVIVVKKLEEN